MGLEIECIPNIQLLPWEFFCAVCRLLVDPNEALQSICSHLYCKLCLAYAASTTMACPYDGCLVTESNAKPLVESNKVLADTIGKVVVHCLYHKSGCTWMGSLSDSSSHSLGCAFGSSLIVCSICGIQVAHRQCKEHAQVCRGMQQVMVQASIQASDEGQDVAAMLTQEQWYQPQYLPYYQNYFGDYMQSQPLLQSQSSVMHQPHALHFGGASLPQAYPSVPPHSQDPSQSFPYSQGLQNLHTQPHSQPTTLSQAHQLQNAQVPQYQQLHGQIQSQLNHVHPQANNVQNSLPQNTIGQGQSHQPHAYWTGQNIYPQPNETNQVGVTANNMPVYHQAGTQPPQLTRDESAKQLVRKYGGASASEVYGIEGGSTSNSTNGLNDVKKHVVELTATQFGPEPKGNETKRGLLGKQVMEETVGNGTAYDPSLNGTLLKEDDNSVQLVGTLNKNRDLRQIQASHNIRYGENPPSVKHEPLNFHQRFGAPSEEVQPGGQQHMHAPPVLRPHGVEISSRTSPGRAAALPSERGLRPHAYPHHEHEVSVGAPKPFSLGSGDGRVRPFPDERLNPASLEPRHLDGGLNHYLRTSHVDNDDFLRSLDRGYGQRIPRRPHEKYAHEKYAYEKYEPDSNLRPTSRFSQPFIDLGEQQLRHGPRSPISEYRGMPSHGSGPSDHGLGGDRAGTSSVENGCRFGFLRSEPKGHGNLQMGERVGNANMVGADAVPNNIRGGERFGEHGSHSLRPGDLGFMSRYTMQGFPGDGGSVPEDVGHFPNPRKRSTMEHQEMPVDMALVMKRNEKKFKTNPKDS